MRDPRRLRLLFLAVMLLLASIFGWLGWRMLEQEQRLWAQRAAERNETVADLVVTGLEKKLSAIEHSLDLVLMRGEPAPDLTAAGHTVIIAAARGSVKVWPEHRLVYLPALPEAPEASSDAFTAADRLEFQKQDYSGAIAALHGTIASPDAKLRAAALVRVARNYLKNGQAPEALKAYSQLSALGAVPVGGLPAGLAGRSGMLAVYEKTSDRAGAHGAAQDLRNDLQSCLWPVTSAAYRYLAEQSGRWIGEPSPEFASRLAVAEGVEWLSESGRTPSGRLHAKTSAGSVLLIWHSNGSAMAGFVGGPEYLQGSLLAQFRPMLDSRGTRLILTSADGLHTSGGTAHTSTRPAIRLASATQLPWTVQVFSVRGGQELEAMAARRRLLIGGVCALVAMIVAGGWFVSRAVARELEAARLQSDFVAAVSHEFRTPLTTLCQLSELLMRGRVTAESDRNEYYGLMHKESQRLCRFLESVLDFGRLEAGRMQFRFERLDLAQMTQLSAAEFTGQPQAHGHSIEVDTQSNGSTVRADRDALRCVLWNLFENAAKYSPECDRVWVELAAKGRHVEIAVRDRGVGIPRGEQRRIFDKFVRGRAARESNIRGTGIGLAVARQIVRAHGGEITVESEPGQGSTFRVLLPQMD